MRKNGLGRLITFSSFKKPTTVTQQLTKSRNFRQIVAVTSISELREKYRQSCESRRQTFSSISRPRFRDFGKVSALSRSLTLLGKKVSTRSRPLFGFSRPNPAGTMTEAQFLQNFIAPVFRVGNNPERVLLCGETILRCLHNYATSKMNIFQEDNTLNYYFF